jgi:GNAT superfamily N-acetyltransferase
MAVAEGARGQGVGQSLMRFAFTLAHTTSTQIGCVGIVVDAKPEAVAFYERLGFMGVDVFAAELGERPAPRPMFLALGSIPRSAD